MSDQDIVRSCLRPGVTRDNVYHVAHVALDALVAERDDAKAELALLKALTDRFVDRAAEAEMLVRRLDAGSAKLLARAEAAEAERDRLEADAEKMYAVLRDSLSVSSARVTELEAVLLEISEKKCLNGNSTCDWPCVVCRARAALGEDAS